MTTANDKLPGRPRVCVVTCAYPLPGSEQRDGWSQYAWLAAHALSAAGADVEVVRYTDEGGPSHQRLTIDGIVVHDVRLWWVRWVSYFLPGLAEGWQLRRFVHEIEGERPFHAIEGPNVDGMCWALALFDGKRFWLRMHTSLSHTLAFGGKATPWRRRFRVWLDGFTARRAANRITHSRVHVDTARQEYQLKSRAVAVVPHGTPEPAGFHRLATQPQVMAIASLTPRKGIEVLLAAFERVRAVVPDARLVVVGSDPSHTGAEMIARHAADADAIELTGTLTDDQLNQRWMTATVVAIPSWYESFGLVAIEAMARGVPIVATTAGALPEVIDNAGVLVPPGNPDALANALIQILTDQTRRAELVRGGGERFKSMYTLERMGQRMLETFGAA